MFELDGKCTIGIDLAALSKNPTGTALLKGKEAETSLVYTDEKFAIHNKERPIAHSHRCPVKPSKKGKTLRKADKETVKKGLPFISSNFPRDENTYLTRKKSE